MPMWGYNATGGMGWWMILSSLFWLGLAAIVVWALVRWLSSASRSMMSRGPNEPAHLSAMDILKARYARGEIDEATFERMRAQLETPAARDALPMPPGR